MSLGMSFARRRMMAAEKKKPKYVWAVYDFAYVLDEENAITGTASLNGTRRRMASSSYTVDASGFTLVNPTETYTGGLFRKYVVDISNVNSTSVSGTYLYLITGISNVQANPITINYTRYSAKAGKGDTELYRVDSDTLDYPVNGEQNGYWYVLVEGEV